MRSPKFQASSYDKSTSIHFVYCVSLISSEAFQFVRRLTGACAFGSKEKNQMINDEGIEKILKEEVTLKKVKSEILNVNRID